MVSKEHVAKIVGAYAKKHNFAADELPALIASVHAALAAAGAEGPPATSEAPVPAMAVRRSIRPESITCLDCGYQGTMLKRHVRGAHGMSPEEYRERWSLKSDYPMVAPAYARRRSDLARTFGLGKRRGSRTP